MAEQTILRVNKNDVRAFHSISEAIGAAGGYWGLPVLIQIAPGVYKERFSVSQPFITLAGEADSQTVITNNHGALEILNDHIKRGTFRTATVMIDGPDFTARNLCFENTAGSGDIAGQALAVYVDTDTAFFDSCRFIGSQDTLFLAPLPQKEKEPNGFTGPKEHTPRSMGHYYFRNCYIAGDIDFIFGGGAAFFENCEIYSINRNKEINGYITAPCTPENEKYGFVFYKCHFSSNCPKGTVYLGRPWRNHARTVLIECILDSHIHSEGFHDWDKKESWEICFFGEYRSFGEGADSSGRAGFVRALTEESAADFTKSRCLEIFYNKRSVPIS